MDFLLLRRFHLTLEKLSVTITLNKLAIAINEYHDMYTMQELSLQNEAKSYTVAKLKRKVLKVKF